MSTSTQNTEAQKTKDKEFTSELPHKVTYSTERLTQEITKIQTNCGLVIERGHPVSAVRTRTDRKDLYANLQVGDIIDVATLKDAMQLTAGLAYRGLKGSIRKQKNKTYKVQRTV